MDMETCIEACEKSREACTLCAEECQRNGNDANAELAEACAKQCQTAIAAMKKGSMEECGTCAMLCAECAEMCASMEGEIAHRCAEACARSGELCGEMASSAGGQAMLF